jgi:hypothetical protein
MCYNHRIPETGSFIKNKHLFLTLLGAGKSKVKVPTSGQGLLAASPHGGRQKGKRTCPRKKRRERRPVHPFIRNPHPQ